MVESRTSDPLFSSPVQKPVPVFTKHSQVHALSFSPDLENNWYVTQFLIGLIVCCGQSEDVLHPNASKYRKNLENKGEKKLWE